MPIILGNLRVGERYDRPFLANLWGYRDWHALGRGAVTPAGANQIVLFITRQKQAALTQYKDHFEGDTLRVEGETGHASDARIIGSKASGVKIYLFYRERHHSPFTFYGRIRLISYNQIADGPSRFVFQTSRSEVMAGTSLEIEKIAHGEASGQFIPDAEGRKTVQRHIQYERSPKNRARAILLHGTRCSACGFDFNRVYGADLARDYIEIHHVKSLARERGVVNPETDLVPLCSNCHSMVHSDRKCIMPVQELKKIIEINNRGR